MSVNLGSVYMTVKTKFNDKEFQKKIQGIQKSLVTLGKYATVAGAAITGAFAASVVKTAAAEDAMHKFGLRTNFSAEAMSGLANAASKSGFSLESLEPGIRRMVNFVDEARKGGTIATETLNTLGLSVQDFANKSPEQIFDLLARKIGEIKDPITQAAIANDIFSRSGGNVIAMMSGGVEAYEEMLRVGREHYGVTQDQLNASAAYTDAMDDLKMSLAEFAKLIAHHVIPAITPWIQKASEILQQVKEWAEENPKLTDTIIKVTFALGGMLSLLGPIAIGLGSIKIAALGLGAIIPTIKGVGLAIKTAFPWMIIITGVAMLAKAIYDNWDEIKLTTKLVWNDIRNYFSEWVDWFKGLFQPVLDIIGKVANFSPTEAVKGLINSGNRFFFGDGDVFPSVPASVPNPANATAPSTPPVDPMQEARDRNNAAKREAAGTTINVHQGNFSPTDKEISFKDLNGALAPAI